MDDQGGDGAPCCFVPLTCLRGLPQFLPSRPLRRRPLRAGRQHRDWQLAAGGRQVNQCRAAAHRATVSAAVRLRWVSLRGHRGLFRCHMGRVVLVDRSPAPLPTGRPWVAAWGSPPSPRPRYGVARGVWHGMPCPDSPDAWVAFRLWWPPPGTGRRPSASGGCARRTDRCIAPGAGGSMKKLLVSCVLAGTFSGVWCAPASAATNWGQEVKDCNSQSCYPDGASRGGYVRVQAEDSQHPGVWLGNP